MSIFYLTHVNSLCALFIAHDSILCVMLPVYILQAQRVLHFKLHLCMESCMHVSCNAEYFNLMFG